ncbi:hypothetical protein JTE90_008008 [Oedothorax gibbosus]|uniref:Uncharacterized protein n=1 Tax=Oedothorax gibbosus TaxID=931172 RepID=A0AAV6UY54_9ARAC|nr:hypothetical protein JTE90_008008 [Oedothorax gibbosus]
MGKGGTKNKEKRTPGKTKRKKKRIKKQEKRKQPKQDMEKTWEGFQLRSSDVMSMYLQQLRERFSEAAPEKEEKYS